MILQNLVGGEWVLQRQLAQVTFGAGKASALGQGVACADTWLAVTCAGESWATAVMGPKPGGTIHVECIVNGVPWSWGSWPPWGRNEATGAGLCGWAISPAG